MVGVCMGRDITLQTCISSGRLVLGSSSPFFQLCLLVAAVMMEHQALWRSSGNSNILPDRRTDRAYRAGCNNPNQNRACTIYQWNTFPSPKKTCRKLRSRRNSSPVCWAKASVMPIRVESCTAISRLAGDPGGEFWVKASLVSLKGSQTSD